VTARNGALDQPTAPSTPVGIAYVRKTRCVEIRLGVATLKNGKTSSPHKNPSKSLELRWVEI
jgi:hypothetical protein